MLCKNRIPERPQTLRDFKRTIIFRYSCAEQSEAHEKSSRCPYCRQSCRLAAGRALPLSLIHIYIQHIIKKAEGGDKTEFEAITYEGYGPGGVAVMVETLTDNRNRTAADLRHYFDKNGGNLGAMGCVAFLFNQKGVIDISLEDKDADEAMMDALDAGAERCV